MQSQYRALHYSASRGKNRALQGEPCDAAVNFDTYQILQRHRAVPLPLHGFLVYMSDRSNAEITHSTLIFMAVTQNYGDPNENRGTRPKSFKSHYYVITLQH